MVWFAAMAAAAEPSAGLRVVTGAGAVVGGIGLGTTAFGLGSLTSPEPYGFAVFYVPGVSLLAVGSGLTLGGSLAQAHRVRADPLAGTVGGVLVGGGVVLGVVGVVGGDDEVVGMVGGVGGPCLVGAGLISGMVQGDVNRRTWQRVTVLPDLERPGLVVAGTF